LNVFAEPAWTKPPAQRKGISPWVATWIEQASVIQPIASRPVLRRVVVIHAGLPATSGLAAASIVIRTPSTSATAMRTSGSTAIEGADRGGSKPGPRCWIGGMGVGVGRGVGVPEGSGPIDSDSPGRTLVRGGPLGTTGSGPSAMHPVSVVRRIAAANLSRRSGRNRNRIATPC